MTKRHLKSYCAPKTWALKRKENKFTAKPSPGKHRIELSMPISLVLRKLGLTGTKKEVKGVLHKNEVTVDSKVVRDDKLAVGLMDVVGIKSIGKDLRVLVDSSGQITLRETRKELSGLKPCKIINKTVLPGGRLQLNLYDGRNIITKEDSYKPGDSVLITLPEQKIVESLKLENGSFVFLVGGKHIGDMGKVEKLDNAKITYTNTKGSLVETLKKYAFVVKEEFLR